jgi:hypothetical protein
MFEEKKYLFLYFRMALFEKSNFSCRKGFIYVYDFLFEKFQKSKDKIYP